MQAFFWAVLATLTLIWGYFRMFETKDRTFGEMDYMVSDNFVCQNNKESQADKVVQFQKGISARKSTKYQINEDEFFMAHDRPEAEKQQG
jgi:SP family general alpha glucoside:H+ symporter-like MFS transporter